METNSEDYHKELLAKLEKLQADMDYVKKVLDEKREEN